MKTLKDLTILAGLSLVLILFFTGTTSAQDTIKKKKEVTKTIQLKIVEDENGNVKVIDTTFIMTGDPDDRGYRYHFRTFEDQREMMEDQARDMERQMKEIEVFIDDDEMEWVDSAADAAGDNIEKRIIIRGGPGPRGGMHRFHGGDFDFNFDYPRGCDFRSGWYGSCPYGNVKEYKIKETKNGKRIIMEVEDGGDVIIVHPRGQRHMMRGPKQIIIEKELQSPPAPPAPPEKG